MANRQDVYHNLIQEVSPIPIDVLLPSLEMHGIITETERSTVQKIDHKDAKLNKLFVEYMPAKPDEIHDKFLKVCRRYKYTVIADYLDAAFKNIAPTKQPNNPVLSTAGTVAVMPPTKSASGASLFQQSYFRWELLELELKAMREAKPDGFQFSPFPVPKANTTNDEDYYPFDPNQKQGYALIINNSDFQGNMPDRKGSEKDTEEMQKLLSSLKYDVRVQKNLTAQQIILATQEFAQLLKYGISNLDGPKYYNSCVVVLMSHGDHGQLYGVDGQSVNEREIFQIMLSVEQLVGRPKIFLIQACRGTGLDWGVQMTDGGAQEILLQPLMNEEMQKDVLNAVKHVELKSREELGHKIPTEADLYVLYSTTPGYYAWRDSESGAWFIQAICQEFSQNAHKDTEDLLSLSTRVQNNVATKFHAFGKYLQMPEMTSRLRKRFRFRL